MKKVALFILLLIGFSGYSQVKWMSLKDAVELQKNNPKKILISFYSEKCSSCNSMERITFSHPVIAELINKYYYPVKFNAESRETFNFTGRKFSNTDYSKDPKKTAFNDFTKYMNVTSAPSIVFLDEALKPITKLQGVLSAKELEPYLPFIGGNELKKITSRQQWENYQRKFRSSIKD